MKKMEIAVTGMSCMHCVRAVRKSLASLEGLSVEDVSIGKVVVSVPEGGDLGDRAVKAIENAGYKVVSTTAVG